MLRVLGYTLHATRYANLVHIDAYRLKDHIELEKLGIKNLVANPCNIILIEWADRVREILPEDTIYIQMDHIDEKTRKISINQL